MTDTTQRLKAVLTAEDQGFTKSVHGAKTAIDGLGLSATAASKSAALGLSAFAKLGLTLNGVTAIANLASRAFRSISGPLEDAYKRLDNLGAVADRLRIAPERLRSLQFAFEELDVEQEAFREGLRKLSITIGNAVIDPVGEANQAFAQIKVSVKDAEGQTKSLDTVLGEIAERFRTIDDEATRSAIAVKLFGRSGDQMVNALAQGPGVIGSLADRARLSIPGYTDTGAMERVAELQRKLIELRLEWQVGWEKALLALHPQIMAFLDKLTAIADKLPALITEVGVALASLLTGIVSKLGFLGGSEFTDSVSRIKAIWNSAGGMGGVNDEGSAANQAAVSKSGAINKLGAAMGFLPFNWGQPNAMSGMFSGNYYELANKAAESTEKLVVVKTKEVEVDMRLIEAIAEYNQRLQDSVDIGLNLRLGIQDYLQQLGAVGDQMRRLTYNIASGMEYAFSTFFFDVVMGKLETLKDALASIAKSLAQVFAGSASQLLGGIVTSGLASAFGLTYQYGTAPGGFPEAPGWTGEGYAPGGFGTGFTSAPSMYGGPSGQRRGSPTINLVFPGVDAHAGAQLLMKNKETVKAMILDAMHGDGDFRAGFHAA